MADTVKIIMYILIALLLIYSAYVVLSCTIPYLLPKKIGPDLKSELDKVEFYDDTANGNERAVLIETPDDAYNIRIEMIRAAGDTLDIAYHNLQVGDTTLAFQGELLRAADRGVNIRLIVDAKVGLGEKVIKDGIRALEAHPNIEVMGYNRLNLLKPWEIPVVFHDKFIIVDDEYLLLGGRNIGDRYYAPVGYDKPVTNDRDVFIWCKKSSDSSNVDNVDSGSDDASGKNAVKQVRDYMNLLWGSEYTDTVWKPFSDKDKIEGVRQVLESKAEMIKHENPKFFIKTLDDFKSTTVATNKITLVANPIRPVKTEPTLGYQLKRLALTAKDNVIVQTPYATANKDLLRAMNEVTNTSSLTVLTNSSASTPNFPAYSTYITQRKKFVETGAQIFELQKEDSIHGKSMSLDGRVGVVGSFNMDDRSFYIDTETMLIIDSPQFTDMLNGAMGEYIGDSLEVGRDNEYIDDPDVEEEPVSALRKFGLVLISIPSRLLQFLV